MQLNAYLKIGLVFQRESNISTQLRELEIGHSRFLYQIWNINISRRKRSFIFFVSWFRFFENSSSNTFFFFSGECFTFILSLNNVIIPLYYFHSLFQSIIRNFRSYFKSIPNICEQFYDCNFIYYVQNVGFICLFIFYY